MPSAPTNNTDEINTDVLVVGGGPAGAAVATWLATAGHDVTVAEKREIGRHKSCGDTLSPRAVDELSRLDVDPTTLGGHEVLGVRMTHGRHSAMVPWPEHPDVANRGVVLRRELLDEHLRRRAAAAGATVLMGHEATAPIAERGFVRGATMAMADGRQRDVHARFVVVADGANSRFGRVLGTRRQRNWPYGIATRTYFESPRNGETWIEAELGLPDAQGNPIAGYGWVTPMGDGPSGRGLVNVGVGVLSSHRDIKGLNTLKLLDLFAERMAEQWQYDPTHKIKSPTRLRVPLGGSVGPKMGPTFLVVGDAGGAANPFSGDGVHAALLCGRLASDVLHEALTAGNSTTLQSYPRILQEELGRYRKVGRLSARFLGRPGILKPALKLAMGNEAALGATLRIATDELRDGHPGGAERAYKLASFVSRFAPSW